MLKQKKFFISFVIISIFLILLLVVVLVVRWITEDNSSEEILDRWVDNKKINSKEDLEKAADEIIEFLINDK